MRCSPTKVAGFTDHGLAEGTGDRTEPEALSLVSMSILGIAVGLIAGGGAVLFRKMIGLFHNLFFLGKFSVDYNANLHTAVDPWGPLVILVPVAGAVIVAFLVKTFAPEARGHGVPEVMDAIYYQQGRIRPIVAAIKSLASAITIGTGGSVGREGPIIQIGSAFGSTLGQILPMPIRQRVVLIAAGAGGGIAATFNTPIGGIAFAIELILPSINASALLPVLLGTMSATYAGRIFFGMAPAFDIPALRFSPDHLSHLVIFPAVAVFGVFLGVAATVFIRSIYWIEDRFDRLPGNYYSRHMLGMLGVGVVIYLLKLHTGSYYVEGIGYSGIEDVLRDALVSPGFLWLLVALKLLTTGLTLGSGGSGGIFSPSLFIGAGLGGAFAGLVTAVLPGQPVDPASFAVVGMAGMVAGATGAVVTAVTMLFEMTRDYSVILPVMLAVGTAYAVRKRLCNANIYTLKLLRRGHVVPEGLRSALDEAHEARHLMARCFCVVPADDPTSLESLKTECPDRHAVLVMAQQGKVTGLVAFWPAGQPVTERDLKIHARSDFIVVPEYTRLPDLLRAMRDAKASFALISRSAGSLKIDDLIGVISDEQIAQTARSWSLLMG
jgi:CIC family chloride channel protein